MFTNSKLLPGKVERNLINLFIEVLNQWLWDDSELLCPPSYVLMRYGGVRCYRVSIRVRVGLRVGPRVRFQVGFRVKYFVPFGF